ncbi:ATP-dependent helicase HrpB [Paraglaciecola sp. 20A4]|uniref:ATP-dependent helicase HrpB n=1 Tax=Paraglaciecola sp. 20A4 TaxID=2687288 RepID=UPI0014073FEA|nr:ATP-dependent helicase HrpB [Paraglaciecola sp. 20A4]
MPFVKNTLPVETIIPQLHHALAQSDVILAAPPGAGKSTCVPMALLSIEQFSQQKIIMLQPRRIAARNIAHYLAKQLGEDVGQTVGYRIRGESRISKATRLEIVTEGILTRMLQSNPELPGVGLVIFDEFHERSMHADFSLALCLEVQHALRDDLRLLIMSATLDVASLSRLLPRAKQIVCEGRSYPVETFYRPNASSASLVEKVASLTVFAAAEHQGDILVFLPGQGEIVRCARLLEQRTASDVKIHCLFSQQNLVAQEAALRPDSEGKRKIILATNIAETSLTIEGITVVVDSGMQKSAVYQLSKGLTQLHSHMISKASATQRMGRAGRLSPGVCYRLWSKEQHQRLVEHSAAEILTSDLSPFLLEASVWGAKVNDFALIDMPTDAQLKQAHSVLMGLQVLDEHHQVSTHGKAVHALGGQANIATMLLKSKVLGVGHQSLACAIAVLLEDKDPLGSQAGSLCYERLTLLQQQKKHPLWRVIHQWYKKLGCVDAPWPLDDTGVLIGFAFPQWIGKSSGNGRYALLDGTGAQLSENDPLVGQPWLAIGQMLLSDTYQSNARITLAEPISKAQIELHFSHLISKEMRCEWDESRGAISGHSLQRLGNIVLSQTPTGKPSSDQINQIWREQINQRGVMALPFSDNALQLIYRLRMARRYLTDRQWPDVNDVGLMATIDDWLLPYLSDVLSWQQLSKLDFHALLLNQLDYNAQQLLNQLLPNKMTVPSSSRIPLEYDAHGGVSLAVRMQEVYGLTDTPLVARGQVKVQMVLLSPAGRPLQQTQDLAGFWQGSYKEVQKEMKGRYQKHFWPDDPANAQATSKTKKKMSNNQ